jgi:hypothetical protein
MDPPERPAMNPDVMIVIVFVGEAVLLLVVSVLLMRRSGFGSPRESPEESRRTRPPGRLP